MIFIDNKYTKWYFSIISTAQSRTLPQELYSEKHHIMPKSAGGSNKKSNLVRLTAKEHFVCHRLLPKMVICQELRSKLLFASWAMATQDPISHRPGVRRRCSSSYYAFLRGHIATVNRLRQTGVSPGNKGIQQSEERKQKNRNVESIQCPHCGRSFKPWLYARWHGNNCRSLLEICGPIEKQKRSARNVRKFSAISPEGFETISTNLKEFCRTNNLSFAQCRRTATGEYKSYKGWKFSYI